MKRAGRVVLAATALGFGGCTPCLGVIDCEGEPHRALSGQVLDGRDGSASAGVQLRWIASYPSGTDSVSTITDSRGLYELSLPRRAETPSVTRLLVLPASTPGYAIDSVPCPALTRVGDGCILEPIMKAPRLTSLLQFRYRGAVDVPVAGVRITFQQTGGSSVLGASSTARFTGVTDAAGNVQPFGDTELFASSMEPMLGDLTVALPAPIGTMVTPNYKLFPRYRYSDRGLLLLPVGPSLAYSFAFIDSATSKGVPKVKVVFDRTGGIPTAPTTLAGHSDPDGIAVIAPRALELGAVDALVTVTVAGRTTTLAPARFTTFDSDSIRAYARFRVGTTGILYPVPPS